MARDHRRLAAIVLLDVVGYSRLMGLDESGTLAALKAHRRELIDPKIVEHDGRIVKGTGDGLLLEFPSVVDAVRCAVEVQRGMAERNAGVAPDQRLDFRIGINVGDIIIDGDDIFGDGVNVAARLEALADPGGICVSRVVRDQVLDKLSFAFEDLGAQEVKNIARPVDVYRVRLEGGPRAELRPRALRRWPLARWARLGAGLFALVAVVSTTLWWNSHRDATPPPHPMSVAVLPFTALGGGSSDERLADMLTNNVTTVLSRDRWVRVVARGPDGGFKSELRDPLRLGRELHVRYLAIGELHREGSKCAVLVHLIDTETGADAWSDRFEFDATDLESDQVRSAARIERRLWNGIHTAAIRHAEANPISSDPWNAYLRASDAWSKGGKASDARKHMEEVLRLDPDFVPALAAVAGAITIQLSEDTEADGAHIGRYKEDMDRLSSRAVVVDSTDSYAWTSRAMALMWLGRWDEALAANTRAQALDPGSIYRLLDRAQIQLLMGRPGEALRLARQAHAMDTATADTADASYFSLVECEGNLASGNYREATPHCERNAASGDAWRDQMSLVAVYAQQGEMTKAATAKAAALKLKPTLTLAKLKAMPQVGSQAYLDLLETHYYAGLRKAGIPEN